MAQPLSVLLPLVLPYLPGCAEIVAEASIRQAAIKFCTGTLAVQRTLAAVPTAANTEAYGFALAADEAVAKLLAATLDGRTLALTTPAAIDDQPGTTGMVRAIYPASSLKYVLWPRPGAAGAQLVARVAIKPTQASATLADELAEDFALDIAQGAIGLTASQAGRSYSAPDLAANAMGLFAEAITRAKVATFNANSRANQRVPPQFF